MRPRARSSTSRPTAPRRCTCCVPRRPTPSSGRRPTAPSPRRTSAWTGWSPRPRSSSASARSRGPAHTEPGRKQLVSVLPLDHYAAAARGSPAHRAGRARRLHRRGAAGCAHPDAGIRHLELPQPGARPQLRARPGQGRTHPGRADPAGLVRWPVHRGRGDANLCSTTRKELAEMAEQTTCPATPTTATHDLRCWAYRRSPAHHLAALMEQASREQFACARSRSSPRSRPRRLMPRPWRRWATPSGAPCRSCGR